MRVVGGKPEAVDEEVAYVLPVGTPPRAALGAVWRNLLFPLSMRELPSTNIPLTVVVIVDMYLLGDELAVRVAKREITGEE